MKPHIRLHFLTYEGKPVWFCDLFRHRGGPRLYQDFRWPRAEAAVTSIQLEIEKRQKAEAQPK